MALTSGAVSLTSRSNTKIVVAGAVATGGSGTYTYQWYRMVGSDQSPLAISGATTATSVSDTNVSSGQLYTYFLVSTDTGAGNATVNSANVEALAYSPTVSGTQTYSSAVTGFTPVATPTDVFNIFGSGSKVISINRLEVSGITSSGTAIVLDLQLYKRSTAGTLGSAALTALTAVPVNSNNSAATATVSTVGTANYTTLGTSVGLVASRKLPLSISPATATDFPVAPVATFTFTDTGTQALILNSATEQVAINLNGATLPTGTALNIYIEWTEQ